MARPLDTPGATNSRKRGWEIVTAASPANASRARAAFSTGSGGPDGEDLRDRVDDGLDEVRHELGASAHERRIVVGIRVIVAEDEPLEMIEVRIQAVLAGPGDDPPGGIRRSGRVRSSRPRRGEPSGGMARMSPP